MSNCVFGFPIQSDPSPSRTPTFLAYGSFVASLPVTNMQDRRLGRLARTTDATVTSTRFRIDLGAAVSVGLIALLVPNITKTTTPTIQWKGGTSAGASDVYNPGAVQAWPTGLTIDDVTGPDGSQQHIWSAAVLTSPLSFRYLEGAVVDTANADGYLDFARLVVAGAYRPSVCMTTGAKSQLENDTVRSPTDGGAALYQARASARTDVFTLSRTMPTSESLGTIRKMQHRLGKSGQLFFVWDDADPYMYERAYLCTMRELGALEYAFSALYNSVGFELSEEL